MALLKRYVEEEGTAWTIELMAADERWCASALCLAEAQVTLCRLGFDRAVARRLATALRTDWERFLVVPVDELCLARAAELGCPERVRTLDAIHLAAADRLPRPVTFATFDARQAEAGRALGLEVPDRRPGGR